MVAGDPTGLESTWRLQLLRNISTFRGATPTTSVCLVASEASQWRPTNLPSLLGYCSVTPVCYNCSSSLKQSSLGKVARQHTPLGSWDAKNDELINCVWALLKLLRRIRLTYQLQRLCLTSCLYMHCIVFTISTSCRPKHCPKYCPGRQASGCHNLRQ